MKKVMLSILAIMAGIGMSFAACMGPFCYDDTGASVAGLRVDGNGMAMPVMSSTTINSITPKAVGQEILCNTCSHAGIGAAGNVGVCVSTATNNTSWVMISSTSLSCGN